MKKSFAFLLGILLFSQVVAAQTAKNIPSKVNKATVFLNKAQINRTVKTPLVKGITTLNFNNLSPFIDAKSIQIKTNPGISILAVNHKKNYLNESKKSEQVKVLEAQIKALEEKIEYQNTLSSITEQNLDFLQKNKEIGGTNQTLTANNLKLAADYYASQYKKLRLEKLTINNKIQDFYKEKRKISKELNTLSNKKEYPTGEIFVKVETSKAQNATFEITYLVGNVSWFPSYDIKAVDINNPLEISYKANLQQNSQVDWKNIELIFSSDNPSVSSVTPALNPYKLSFNQIRKSGIIPVIGYGYVDKSNVTGANFDQALSGRVAGLNISGANGEPGAAKKIVIRGANTIKNNNNPLYIVDGVITENFNPNSIKPDNIENMNVLKDVNATSLYGSRGANGVVLITTKNGANASTIIKQTAVNFKLNKKHTVKSNVIAKEIKLKTLQVPATYQYFAVPKMNNAAYLTAKIKDWEKYQLLDGETNIFFDNTFKSKGLLDLSSVKEEIVISLGIDKQITVERSPVTENVGQKFLSKNVEKQRHWKIDIKNNKNQDINIQVLDQVPVSITDEIEVEVVNISNAKQDDKSGELKWILNIPKTTKKTLDIQYHVKHAKNRRLIVD